MMARGQDDRVERALLGLLRAGMPVSDLSAEDWDILGAMAAEHRIEPVLHAERGQDPVVPQALRATWSDAHRNAALTALAQRRDLLLATDLLRREGFGCAALKGSCLAWEYYSDPALRPCRDIDLLVPQREAMAAWQALLGNGFVEADPGQPPEVRHAPKHLPGLIAPGGTLLELHLHCWELAEQVGHSMPPRMDEAILSDAQGGDIPWPAPHHLLAHLAVHAVYSNWLDGGPLALIDMQMLAARLDVDWPHTWEISRQGGWDRGLALLVALTDRWRCPGLLEASGCPVSVNAHVMADAPTLLFQPLAERSGAALLAGGAKGAGTPIDRFRRARREGLVRWFISRIVRTAGDLRNRHLMERAQAMTRLGKWLESG